MSEGAGGGIPRLRKQEAGRPAADAEGLPLAHGLMACMDSTACCIPFFCPMCRVVKAHNWLNQEQQLRFCSCTPGFQIFLAGMILDICRVGFCVQCSHHLYVRRRVLRRLNIQPREELLTTICISTCCQSCSSVQITDTILKHTGAPVRLFMSDEDARERLLQEMDDAESK